MTRRLPEGGGIIIETAPRDDLPSSLGMENETIAAIGTPAGSGGIGIIRISGGRSHSIARKIFRPARAAGEANGAGFYLKPHKLCYGYIVNPDDGRRLDEVLVAFMPAPNSYTREDVLEIQCHGGGVVIEKILGLVLMSGARPAEAGEFTRRAFLNGRIDLTQAEAVADMINARSESAMKLAARQLGGELKFRIKSFIEQITDTLAHVEAELEFGEDGVNGISDGNLTSNSLRERLIEPLSRLTQSYIHGRVQREGLRLAIVGRPNVGKSSLLNRLIDREKAIVTPFPGTTRDPVEASATIDNVAIGFIDTAGIRETSDPVERIGIQKTKEALKSADLTLLVTEANTPPNDEDDHILREIKENSFLIVVNKIDLIAPGDRHSLPKEYAQNKPIFISAKNGEGLDVLRDRITKVWRKEGGEELETVLCELRHKIALEAALADIRNAAESIDEIRSLDMVAMDLKHALEQMQSVIGKGTAPDVLDQIFQKFCIGK